MNDFELKALEDGFFEALRLNPWKKFPVGQCSYCLEFTGFVSDGKRPGMDDSCGCSDYNDPIAWCTWKDLQYLLEPEKGFLEKVRNFTEGVHV